MTEVWLELAIEENADVARGKESLHEVSAGKWLAMGLDLEEQQWVSYPTGLIYLLMHQCRRILVWQASKKVSTLGDAELQEKRHTLCRRIDSWCNIQQVYMPCIDQVRAAHLANANPPASSTSHDPSVITPSAADKPETIPLFLPSSIQPSFWSAGCILGLIDKERRLRIAQADDGLKEL
jgi:hypothetical protein